MISAYYVFMSFALFCFFMAHAWERLRQKYERTDLTYQICSDRRTGSLVWGAIWLIIAYTAGA